MKHLLGILCCFLCSCSTVADMFEPDPLPTLNLPAPRPIKMEKVKFKVLTRDNIEEYFKSMDDDTRRAVVFALTGQDYKNLAINMQKLKAYIQEQAKIIKLYKEYYENGGRNGYQE